MLLSLILSKYNSDILINILFDISSKNPSKIIILILYPYSIYFGFRYNRAESDFNKINFKIYLWKLFIFLKIYHWNFDFNKLYIFFIILIIPKYKLVILFQYFAKFLIWNYFWRYIIEICFQIDRSQFPIFWFRA